MDVAGKAALPDFRSEAFLLEHMRSLIDFYYPRCINDTAGGYYNSWRDDGEILDKDTQHLVSTSRFIVNFSLAADLLERPELIGAAEHGLDFLAQAHWDAANGGYRWLLHGRTVRDGTRQCYGHAFALLAWACAVKAGIAGANAGLERTFEVLEARFWSPAHELYVDEIDETWSRVAPYRGQNANMHMTEAMLAAFEATGEARYLDRAELLARRICVDLSARTHGLLWEHYTQEWLPDWDYNRDDPKHLFRPYGYLPGHFTEWTKLLLILERHRARPWMLPKARHLYDAALARSADLANGGMHYTFGPDGRLYDLDKYHWVHCETLAAAASLAVRTGEERFWQDYDRLWDYSWRHFVDHRFGGWFRILTPEGRPYNDVKSPPAKTDYHPFGACFEVLRVLGRVA